MRLLFTGIHEGIVGGVETYLRTLVPELLARGHDCVYAFELPRADHKAPVVSPNSLLLDSTFLAQVASFEPDVIVQNSLRDPRRELALAEKWPVVFVAHAYGGMCISGTRRHARPAPEVCSKRFGLECWKFYFTRRCGGLNPGTALSLYRENQLRRQALLAADAVVAASETMSDLVKTHGVPAELVTTIPYYVPPPPELTSSVVRTRHSAKRALFLGRLTDLKGWRLFLRAAAILRERGNTWKVVIAGDGPDRQELQAEASRLNLRLELHPWLEPRARDELIEGATVLVLPSTWPEPFGLVGLEAARLGVPTVAFDVGGIRDWLIPERTGLLASPGSSESLASSIARSVDDEFLYHRMSEEARLQAQSFSIERYVKALEAVLRRAAGRPSRNSCTTL
jgi:glycosyltransferase involved in cell wall biosynthesis